MISAFAAQSRAAPCLLGALALAASVRGYLLWQYYCISSDGVVYIRAAQDFFAGNFAGALQSVYPPGYPLLIALAYPLIGDWELAGQWLSILFGTALLVPLYWIFRELFDARVAGLACYLAALSPFLALYSVHVRSESTFLFLSAAAFYLFFRALQEWSMTEFFRGGLVAGYAFLVRPEAIGFLLIIPAVILLRGLHWREWNGAQLFRSNATLAAGFAVFALPYIVYLSIDTGHFGAISRKAGITLAINLQESGWLDGAGEGHATDVGSFVFTDYVLKNPLSYIKKITLDLPGAAGTFVQALYYSYLPFLLLGLGLALRKYRLVKSHWLLFAFVIFYVFGFALIYVKRRYALQAVPLSLAWVALGMTFLWDYLRERLSVKMANVTAGCIALAFLGATLPRTLKPVSREKSFVREAGRYLKARNHHGALGVAAFDERVPFYAAARSILIGPQRDAVAVSRYLRENKADYLAAEAKIFAELLPEISRQPEQYGLILEQDFIGTRKDRMLLFRVI